MVVFSAPGVSPAVRQSVDDTMKTIGILRRRFPELIVPSRDDLCYATRSLQDEEGEWENITFRQPRRRPPKQASSSVG